MKFNCEPIGHFFCPQTEKYMAPKQPALAVASHGKVVLCSGMNFEQAVADLVGFERIWLLYWFDRNTTWKPKVATPRGGTKRSVFATRAPHRPNPIGLSCVELISIDACEVFVGKNDLLDGTPILDIKPYLPYADAFPDSCEGWTDSHQSQEPYTIAWSTLAMAQAQFILQEGLFNLIDAAEQRLRDNPFPFPSHRIEVIEDNRYCLAIKTWRIHYAVEEGRVVIQQIVSGYDQETLQGLKTSRWDDVPLHMKFIALDFA